MMRRIKRAVTILVVAAMVITMMTPGMGFVTEVHAASKVTRIQGATAVQTSFKIADALKKQLGVEKFDAIILARSNNYPDALSGSSLAAEAKAPILMVNNSVLTDTINYVNNNLKPGGTVYILGGVLAVPEAFETGFNEALEANVVRLGGKDRYETNLIILQEIDRLYAETHDGKVNDKVLVCTGKTYADALATGALGRPMILVGDMFTQEQMNYVARRGQTQYTIIGGTKAVGENIVTDCNKFGTTTRVYGNSRYETAVQIAKKYFGNTPSNILLVYGDNFPDGIASGVLAYYMKSPIILISGKSNIAAGYNYQVNAGRPATTIIGGTSVVSDKLAAPNNSFSKGWNKFGNNYIFVNSKGLVINAEFTDAGYSVKPTAGGLISVATREEVKRRQESAIYGTAIIIDISDQKLDYVEGGVVRLTTSVVTGNRGTHDTPTGNYYILGKQYSASGKIPLSGREDDGSPYTSYVSYWMPFIGAEYGIHDATWRSYFGGNIYRGNGSHGCVNVPKSSMASLYNMVSVWTRVIIKP